MYKYRYLYLICTFLEMFLRRFLLIFTFVRTLLNVIHLQRCTDLYTFMYLCVYTYMTYMTYMTYTCVNNVNTQCTTTVV